MTSLIYHPSRFSLFVNTIGRTLNEAERVVAVIAFPSTQADADAIEQELEKHLVKKHPKVPNVFHICWTPLNSTPLEIGSLLKSQTSGIILIDNESYRKFTAARQPVGSIFEGIWMQLFKTGKITVFDNRR